MALAEFRSGSTLYGIHVAYRAIQDMRAHLGFATEEAMFSAMQREQETFLERFPV